MISNTEAKKTAHVAVRASPPPRQQKAALRGAFASVLILEEEGGGGRREFFFFTARELNEGRCRPPPPRHHEDQVAVLVHILAGIRKPPGQTQTHTDSHLFPPAHVSLSARYVGPRP